MDGIVTAGKETENRSGYANSLGLGHKGEYDKQRHTRLPSEVAWASSLIHAQSGSLANHPMTSLSRARVAVLSYLFCWFRGGVGA